MIQIESLRLMDNQYRVMVRRIGEVIGIESETAELYFPHYPTLQEIIDATVIQLSGVQEIDPVLAIKKAVLSEVFAGLDASSPTDLQIAVDRYHAIMLS